MLPDVKLRAILCPLLQKLAEVVSPIHGTSNGASIFFTKKLTDELDALRKEIQIAGPFEQRYVNWPVCTIIPNCFSHHMSHQKILRIFVDQALRSELLTPVFTKLGNASVMSL